MRIRRVVTGHDEGGRAVVSSDEPVDPVTIELFPGYETYELWSVQGDRGVPDRLGQPGIPSYFPTDANDVFCRVVTFPP